MTSFLCLSITFLDPQFHGRADGDVAEWPPSPLRLFQAMVAATHANGRTESTRSSGLCDALKWLEQQPAPTIVAPAVKPSQPFRLSVPNNSMDVVARAWCRGNESGKDAKPATHQAMKTVEGKRFVEGDTLHFLWRLPDHLTDEIRSVAESLITATQNVVALGWGIDMVVARGQVVSDHAASAVVGERWFPVPRLGVSRLRVPVKGTLDALCSRYEAFRSRLAPNGTFRAVSALTAFDYVHYARESDKPLRPFAAFQLMDPEGQRFRAFRLTQAAKVAAILRHAVAAVVKQTGHAEPGVDPNDWLNLYVHGHARTNDTKLGRFAYLPLPSIRPQDVVGDIRRALIVEPLDGLGQHAGWASRMVPGRNLVNEETKKPEALLVHASAKDYVIDRYVAPAREWVTVTPVVLPWGDSGKPHRAVKQFFKALRHAAYRPEDVEVELRREPFWAGTSMAQHYFVPSHLKKRGLAVYHARLRWNYEVPGPLIIGSGRFCGLGLFAAFDR